MKSAVKIIPVSCFILLIALIGCSVSLASGSSKFKLSNYNQASRQVNFSFSLLGISETSSYKSLDRKLVNVRNKLSDYDQSKAATLRKSFMVNIAALEKQILFSYKFNYKSNLQATEAHGKQLQTSLNKDYASATTILYRNYKKRITTIRKKTENALKKNPGSSLNSRVRKYNLNKNKILRKWESDRRINLLFDSYNQFYNTVYQKMLVTINNNQLQSREQAEALAINNYRLLENKINQINLLLKRVNNSFAEIKVNKTLPPADTVNNEYLKRITIESPVPEPSSNPPSLGINPLIVYQKSELICSIGKRYLKEKRRVVFLQQQIRQNNQTIGELITQGDAYQQKITELKQKIASLISKLNTSSITEYDRYTQQIAKFKKQVQSIQSQQDSDKRKTARLSLRNKANQKEIAENQADAYQQKQRNVLDEVPNKIKRVAYKRCPRQII